MKVVTTTTARKHIRNLVDQVRQNGEVFGIGRRNQIEVLMIKFPTTYNSKLDDITNINTYSASFDFLADEPELYSMDDLKKSYVS